MLWCMRIAQALFNKKNNHLTVWNIVREVPRKIYILFPRRINDDSETGSIALSPILKRHNAYMVHNETLYCDETDVWRGKK